MKLFLGKQLVTKVISTALNISSFEDVLALAKETAVIEEAVVEMAVTYYNVNKGKVNDFLDNLSDEDIMKAHNFVKKALSYKPEWDNDLNINVTFKEEA